MAPIADYEFTEVGWHWIYELYGDRLALLGLRGKEQQRVEAELRHASPTPDCWMEEYNVRYPRWLVLTALGVMVPTFLPCCGVFTFGDFLGRHVVAPTWVWNIWTATFVLLGIEFSVASLTPFLLRIKHFRRLVRFKRNTVRGGVVCEPPA